MEGKADFLQLNPRDTVAVALRGIARGETVQVGGCTLKTAEAIPFGHKMALRDVATGEPVIKYGFPIGHTTRDVAAGSWVHTHNLQTNLSGTLHYTYVPRHTLLSPPQGIPDTFDGYVRADGSVGIRNEVWIIPTVGCVSHTARILQERGNARFGGLCDGIFAFPHTAGCSQLGDDLETAQKILAGLVRHPNAGGVLVLGLGCENNNFDAFRPYLGQFDPNRVRFLGAQTCDDEIEDGLSLLGELAAYAGKQRRQTVPASRLTIGLKCGGSDAFSGITANPLCGRICDTVTSLGGRAMLTEVPEMFGAETILMERAKDRPTFEKIVNLINGFKQYYIGYGQPIYENPAPGNKEGGITTLEEKSLGCVQKGGRAIVTDTLSFGEPCRAPGLSLLAGPGNDGVSITNLASSGAQMILFTTGRGNPLGTAVPTVKLASNRALAARKPNWIDFDAGGLADGLSFDEAHASLWQYLLGVASGRIHTKNEINGYREIAVFKNGVTL